MLLELEVFANVLPTTVFLYGSAGFLVICAVAALWMRRVRTQRSMSAMTAKAHG
jgi:hypothetical protein